MAIRKRRRTRKRTRRRKRGGDDGYSSDTGFHKTITSPEGFPIGTEKTGKGASIHLTRRQKRNQGIYKLASDKPSLRGMDAEKIGKIYDQQKEAAMSKSRNARATRLALMKKKTRKQSAGKRKRKRKRKTRKNKKITRRRRKRRTSKKQIGSGMGWSSTIGPIQPQGDYTLPVANIAKQTIGLGIDQFPSCDGNQCQTWSKEGPSPKNPVPTKPTKKPRPRNPKKKTQKEKEAIAAWRQKDENWRKMAIQRHHRVWGTVGPYD